VRAGVEVETGEPGDIISFSITDPDGQEIASAEEMIGDNCRCETVFNLQNARLWWPAGYGKQPLYQLAASLNHAVFSRLPLPRLSIAYV
jgi:beta-galactosidase/beta-glucuronidase